MKNDEALTSVLSLALIIMLVFIMAGVVLAFSTGIVPNLAKPAFIAPEIGFQTISGKNVVSILNRGGDTRYLGIPKLHYNTMGVYVDTPSQSALAKPLPGVEEFRPGTTLYLYKSGDAYRLTNNPADIAASSAESVPEGQLGVRLVDENSQTLIARWGGTAGGASSPTPEQTPTPTPTLTPSPTPESTEVPVRAAFTRAPYSGVVPVTVQFTDTSTGPVTSREWAFGDGSGSAETNPAHTFAAPGRYTVSLTVQNATGGSNSTAWPDCVTVLLRADFSGAPLSGTTPLTVQFTDTTSGTPTAWSWDFGDGTSADSTVENPVHVYNTAGTYTVRLTVSNADGSNTTAKPGYVTVTAPASTGLSISWIWPDYLRQGRSHKDVDIEGTGFVVAGTTKVILRHQGDPDINGEWVSVLRPTHLITDLYIPDDATPGDWDVIVVNPDGQTATLKGGFEVRS